MDLPTFPELLARVREAFPPDPIPDEDLFGATDCFREPCYECWLLERHFGRERWDLVPDTAILAHHDDLSLFTEAGFVYYLPAYLSYSLRHFHVDDSVLDWIRLVIPGLDSCDSFYEARLARLDRRQRDVLREFIDLAEGRS